MKVEFYCPYWGCEGETYTSFLNRVKGAGYDGVEMVLPTDRKDAETIKAGLSETGLKLIAQNWLEPQDESPEQYMERMEIFIRHLASFNPVFINSHTGRDYYSFEENCKIIEKTKELETELGVEICHETHRGRFNYSAASTNPFLEKYPYLKMCIDFSHWVCVSETYLQDQNATVQKALIHAKHIHARVGHTEGPQVTHPAAPEWKEALDHHLAWWDTIIQNNQDKETFTITNEFGPEPYLPTLPFTNQRVASQWEINVYMKDLLSKRYNG